MTAKAKSDRKAHVYYRSLRTHVSCVVIHRDACIRMGASMHWTYADNVAEKDLLSSIYLSPWLRGCKYCMPKMTWEQ